MPAARPSLPPPRFVPLLAAIMVMPSIGIIGTMFLTNLFKARQCPAGSVLWGTNQTGHLALILPLPVLSLVAIGWFLAFGMARRGRSLLGVDARFVQHAIAWSIPVLGGLWLLLVVNGVYAGFCATPQTVSYRQGVFDPIETYSWNDVVRVVATCRHVSGRQSHDDVGYWLIMHNGRQIDLGYADVSTARLVGIADAAMRGVPHGYDASGVSPGCDPMQTTPLLADATAAR